MKRIKTIIKFVDWKLLLTVVLIYPIIWSINYFSIPKLVEEHKEMCSEQIDTSDLYDEAYKKGWLDKQDQDSCLLRDGMVSIDSQEPPYFIGCITKIEADRIGVSYTGTFKDWCEFEGTCK